MNVTISVIFVKEDSGNGEEINVAGAWDEYSLYDNPEDYEKEIKKLERKYGKDNVCVGTIQIEEDSVAALFEPRVLKGSKKVKRGSKGVEESAP